jgi:hypothetical protein
MSGSFGYVRWFYNEFSPPERSPDGNNMPERRVEEKVTGGGNRWEVIGGR